MNRSDFACFYQRYRSVSVIATTLMVLLSTVVVSASDSTAKNPNVLAGSAWQLLKIMSMDDSVYEPRDRSLYRLEFRQDGSAAILADCNRGVGTWQSKSGSQLEFGPVAATMAQCPPGSLSDRFLAQFQWVRTYMMKNSHLYLATMADGSIIEFEPLDIPAAHQP